MTSHAATIREFVESCKGRMLALWTGWQIGEKPQYFVRVLAVGEETFMGEVHERAKLPGFAKRAFRFGGEDCPSDERGQRLIPYRSVRALAVADEPSAEADTQSSPRGGMWR